MATDPFAALESLNPLARQRTQPTPAEMQPDDTPGMDRFDRAVQAVDEQKKREEVRRLQETPADQKRRTQVARDLGMKPSEIIDLGRAEHALKIKRQMEEREKYPAIAKLFDEKPDLASVMLGNEEELSGIGALWDFFSKAPGRTYEVGARVVGTQAQSISQEVQETVLPFFAEVNKVQARLTGVPDNIRDAEEFAAGVDSWIAEGRRRIAFSQEEVARQREVYGSSNYWANAALQGLDSIPASFLAGAATIATRNPNVGAALMGVGVGAESVQSAKAKGLSGISAYAYGITQGSAEAVFERAPMGELLKLGGRGFLSGVGKFLLKEVPGELATTTVQSFTDWAMLPENRGRAFGDWVSGLPEEYLQTVIGTVVGGGAQASAFKALDVGVQRAERFVRQRDAQRQMAAIGKFEGDFLDRLGGQLASSTLRTEDPEAFAQLMRDFATDRGVSTVLIPGEAVRDYLQSSAFEGENDPLAPYQQAALEAAAAGNDIALPIETALTALPGSKAWEALKDDMRLTAGGMSRRQAEALEASEEAMLEEFRQTAEATDSKAKKEGTAREARLAKITTKLEEDGGFAPAEAARQAELLVARMTTRAARMGRDDAAVDQAVDSLSIRQVMPPELQRAMAAQEQDMVLAAVRGNTKGSTSRARAAAAELTAVLKRQGWTPEQLSDEQLGQVVERLAAAGANDGREYRADAGPGQFGRELAGDGRARDRDGATQALDGAPQVEGATGPDLELASVAESYAAAAGIPFARQAEYAAVDPEFAARIAEAYEGMEHAPEDPAVAEAYADLIRQTTAQYEALVEAGYVFTFFDEATDPYEGNPWNAMRDLRENKRMAVFATRPLAAEEQRTLSGLTDDEVGVITSAIYDGAATEGGVKVALTDTEKALLASVGITVQRSGVISDDDVATLDDERALRIARGKADAPASSFGSSDFDATGNPLLAMTEYQWADQNGVMHPVTANDLFRAVHDAFGHGLEGAGFRARGEENAWQAHARLFTGPALAALTTETRGQNSWLNFGPFGEQNRNASVEETTFADQKTGLLPSWAWTENVVPDMERDYEQATAERLGERGDASGIGDVGVDARTVFPKLDRPPVNEDGTVTLDHFTGEEGLTQTDPAAWGRSGKFLPDSERARIGTAPGRTYFGIATQRGGYVNEFQSGKHPRSQKPIQRVSARIPFDRLYDMYGDPDGLKAIGRALPKNEQGKYIYKGKPVDGVSLLELLIQDAGYAGYWTPAIGLTAAVFEPVEVLPYDAARDDYTPAGMREFEQATIFYSALERAAEAVKTERAPAAQWIATLKNAPGVKAEELEWTGIIDWLEAQTGVIEKSAVLDGIRRGGVVVSEIELRNMTEDDLDTALIDERVWDQDDNFYVYYERQYVAAEVEVEEEVDGETETITKFRVEDRYGDPVEETLYDDQDEADEAAVELDQEGPQAEAYAEWANEVRQQIVNDMLESGQASGGVQWSEYAKRGSSPSYRELLITLPPMRGTGNPTEAGPTHFDGQAGEDLSGEGIIAHARFADARGPNGERILFLEEVQSDWHQRGLKEGYDVEADPKVLADAQEKFDQARKALTAAVAELADLIKAPVTATDILAPDLIAEKPGVAEAVAKRDKALNEQADSREYLEAIENGADPETFLKARAAMRDAEKGAEEAEAAVQRDYVEAARPAMLALAEWLDERVAWGPGGGPLRALQGDTRLNPSDINYFYATMKQAFANNSEEERQQGLPLLTAATDAIANEKAAKARAADEEASQAERLRQTEFHMAKRGGDIPDAPFKKTWPELVMKRMIAWASANGYDQIAWIKEGEQNAGRTRDSVDWFYGRNLPNMTNKLLKPYKAKVRPLRVDGNTPAPMGRLQEIEDRLKEIGNAQGLVVEAYRLTQDYSTDLARSELQEKWTAARERVERNYEQEMGFVRANQLIIDETKAELDALTDEDSGRAPTLKGLVETYEFRRDRAQEHATNHKLMLENSADFDALWGMAMEAVALMNERDDLKKGAPTNLGFDITPELREASAGGFPLFQPDHKNMPRGRILFPGNDDQGAVIELFQGRDLSTLIHESSHLWLEELKADAADPNAPEQVKRDWQIVLDWFKANGHEVKNGIIPVGAHEMWARGGEKYMREGKAPSVGLKRAFETFRGWLTNLYKTVRGLNSPITPEIREVFDRLLATDAEITEARAMQGMDALFNTAVEAGMSPDEFANYQEQVASSRAEAQGKVLEKAMADIARRETRLGKERRRQIKDQVSAAIEDAPLFKALAVLREERMDRTALVERFGEDVVGQLPSRVPPLYAEGGVDPEIIAERAGFNSAEAMVNAMVAAEADQKAAKEGGDKRSLKARMIGQMTDAAMAAQYGDTMTPEQMREEALDAVSNDRQGEVIASEIAALARKTGKGPTPYRMARQWARTRVRQGTFVAEASKQALERHRRAIAAAGREAEQALIAGDMEAVYRAKQKQMLSSALLSEAKAANEEVETARARMDRIAKARTMKSVDQDYLEQAHTLLEEVELKQRTQRSIDRFEAWSAWVKEQEAGGREVMVPDTFMAQLGNTNWTRLPVEQLLGLDATVRQVIHFGRMKQTLLDNRDRRDYEEVKAEIKATAALVGKKEPKSDFAEPGWWDSIKGGVASLDAALLKAETLFDWLDNGDPDGVFNRYVFRPIARAAGREADMLRDFYTRHKANLEAIPASTLKTWAQKINTGWMERKTGQPLVLSRQQVIAMALNWGNAGNRQRLVDGYGLNEIGVENFLMDTLTAEEWAFVQSSWDLIGELWPEIAAMERRVNGVEPDKVEPITFNTPHGPMRGGYYPAIYNTQIDRKAQRHADQSDDLMNAKTVRATTTSSATKERSETVKRPILLDLGVIPRHMGEVIHDITHREAVIQAYRLLNDPEVLDEIDSVLGREYSEQLVPWVKYVANRWSNERSGNEGWSKFFGKLRANATVVGMGFRFTTMMTQLAGYSNSIEYVGEKQMAQAIARFGASPVETTTFVREKSAEMRNRFDTLDRDINQEIRRSVMPTVAGGAIKSASWVKVHAFHGIGYMDMVVSVPTWLGAYNKALEAGANEEQAIYQGDKAVRLSQGSGDAKDLAAVQRGTGPWGEALKLMTMFYSYMSAFYQRQRRLGRDAGKAMSERDLAALPGLISRAWWLLVVPPLMAEILSMRAPEEDEEWTWWAFEKMMSQMLGPIPVVRDLWSPVYARITGQPSFGYRFTPAQGAFETGINVAGDIGNVAQGEETTRMTRNVLELVGFSTGLVPGQVASATQFIVDVSEGEQDPQTAGDWFTGLTKGKLPEE